MTTLREAALRAYEILEMVEPNHDATEQLRAALAAEQREPTVWYCPECGSISDTESRCCPDWIRKRLVTKNFAESCQRTFRGFLAASPQANQPQPAEQGEPDKDLIIIGLKALSHHVRLVPAYANLVGDMDTVDIAVRKLKAAPQPAEQCPDCGKPLGSAGDIHTCSPQVIT